MKAMKIILIQDKHDNDRYIVKKLYNSIRYKIGQRLKKNEVEDLCGQSSRFNVEVVEDKS